MVHSLQFCHPSRIAFDLPELLEIQRAGFNKFLKQGISNLFLKIPPIKVEQDNLILELFFDGTKYQLVSPDDNPRDCILKMKTYSCKLYVQAKVVCTNQSGKILDATKEEWILVGHLPLMTKRGHFIINGSPRVIVHQVVRSPGIYFQQVLDKNETKRIRFYGDIIPFRGVWLRLQITKKGKIEAKLKKGKKVLAPMLQKCLQLIEKHQDSQSKEFDFKQLPPKGFTSDQIKFYHTKLFSDSEIGLQTKSNSNLSEFVFSNFNSKNLKMKKTKQILESNLISKLKKIKKSTKTTSKNRPDKLVSNITKKFDTMDFAGGLENKALLYTYDKLYRPIEDKEKEEISKKKGNRSFQHFIFVDNRLKLKKCYKNLFSTFKDKNRYNLSDLGREKINTKLGINVFETQLTALDIRAASNWLHKLTKGEKSVDDIDHFQNRRIRTSGELLEIQFESGIDRLTKLAWNKLKEYVNSKFAQNSPTKISYSQLNFDKNSKTIEQNIPTQINHTMIDFLSGSSLTRLTTQLNGQIKKTRLTNRTDHRNSLYTINNLKEKNSFGKKTRNLLSTSHLKETEPFFFNENLKKSTIGTIHKTKKENKTSSLLASISLKDLLSTKPINGALRELFGANPLSQYMDQTNPLAEITHKRRMSSLGIGGVSRESAGMAIRGIHPTHYGRICPIETPEGKNAGLVNSLAFYSKINEKGFIETPYYKVVKGQVQSELGFTFFSAKRESLSHLNIAPSDLQQSWNNKLTTDFVPVRVADNLLDLFKKIDADSVDCIGVSPIQMISVATSLIPFLEHNDANRALMGSNMQRQAVPLMIPERPIVGTGLEAIVVAESGHISQTEFTGFISYVSANQIVIESLNFFNSNSKISIKQKKVVLDKQVFFLPKKWNTISINAIDLKTQKNKSFLTRALNPLKLSSKITEKKSKILQNWHTIKQNGIKYIFTPNKKYQKKSCLKLQDNRFHHVPLKNRILTKHISNFNLKNVSIQNWVRSVSLVRQMSVNQTFFGQIFFNQLVPSTHFINNFERSNQDTCLMQRVSVKEGDWVQKGDILTDCSASDKGELSVGKNILVAYMPWEGYNFEDAIVINERLVNEHVYTSLHIERYDFNAQDVKEGNEWFTKDLPGIPSKKVKHLDEFGLPKIGSFVQEGDILIGKMKYSNKKPTTPYERLLCDILGENNFSARDSSLYVPKGVHARVIKHKILALSEKPVKKTDPVYTLDRPSQVCDPSFRRSNVRQTLFGLTHVSQTSFRPASLVRQMDIQQKKFKQTKTEKNLVKNKLEKSKTPKIVHIFLGEKRALQIGDKMSGRHGNKGVVATILPKQDMPYLADGTPVDIILNPLGVPSRMNVGQVFEALLGLAGTYLAQHFKITAFDELYGIEASQSLIYLKLYQARLQSGQNWLFQVDFPGKTRLIDGRSGQCFDQWVTVGRAYILKLIHMVNEKIHARATGPYALITQQPLRGRSQKGGQRLGEMEVWALEGFGAAYTLQELLTKKSDDIVGRKEVASAILPRPFSIFDKIQFFNTRRENRLMLGQPEIFKVLICELQALCLDVGVYSLTTKSFKRHFLYKVN